jgi:lysozyme family protein
VSFPRAVTFVLAKEGGYTNDPADSGGPTNFGIALNRHPELTAEDIRTMTPQRASDIYRNQYWAGICGDSLPDGVDLVMLDISVNMGIHAAVECLQHVLGLTVDGVMGPQTLGATQAANPKKLVSQLTTERIKRYAGMAGWPKYGQGWTARSVDAAIEGVTG